MQHLSGATVFQQRRQLGMLTMRSTVGHHFIVLATLDSPRTTSRPDQPTPLQYGNSLVPRDCATPVR